MAQQRCREAVRRDVAVIFHVANVRAIDHIARPGATRHGFGAGRIGAEGVDGEKIAMGVAVELRGEDAVPRARQKMRAVINGREDGALRQAIKRSEGSRLPAAVVFFRDRMFDGGSLGRGEEGKEKWRLRQRRSNAQPERPGLCVRCRPVGGARREPDRPEQRQRRRDAGGPDLPDAGGAAGQRQRQKREPARPRHAALENNSEREARQSQQHRRDDHLGQRWNELQRVKQRPRLRHLAKPVLAQHRVNPGQRVGEAGRVARGETGDGQGAGNPRRRKPQRTICQARRQRRQHKAQQRAGQAGRHMRRRQHVALAIQIAGWRDGDGKRRNEARAKRERKGPQVGGHGLAKDYPGHWQHGDAHENIGQRLEADREAGGGGKAG